MSGLPQGSPLNRGSTVILKLTINVTLFPPNLSYELLSDGAPHTVQLVAANRTFTLTVDEGSPRSVVNDGKHTSLDFNGASLYLGGVPTAVAKHAKNHWHLRNTTSFVGTRAAE